MSSMANMLPTRLLKRSWCSILGRLSSETASSLLTAHGPKVTIFPPHRAPPAGLNIYSELLPCTQKIAELSWKPQGVVLSGGPYSVCEADAPHVDPAIFELNLPILGICYGWQEIAWHFRKNVLAGEKREHGHVALKIERHTGKEDHINRLFQGLQDNISEWMSHGDKLSRLPDDFQPIASTINAPFAGIASISRPYFGLQFHPEVTTAPKILFNFAVEVYKARQEYDLHY